MTSEMGAGGRVGGRHDRRVGGRHELPRAGAALLRRAALGLTAVGLVSVALVAVTTTAQAGASRTATATSATATATSATATATSATATATSATATATSAAGSTPTPPSPLDLIAQVGAVANAQSRTEAALLSLDAQIRNSLNGTTAGYVYNLASDAVQALTGPLKDIVTGVTNAQKELVEARARTIAMRAWWTKEHDAYANLRGSSWAAENPGTTRWTCDPATPAYATCTRWRIAVITSYNHVSTTVLVAKPPPPAADNGTYPNGMLARNAYSDAYGSVVDVAGAAVESLTAARAIVGDAKDYPGNKLFEAILQVLGEHRLTTALGKVVADRLPLVNGIKSSIANVSNCLSSATTMANFALSNLADVTMAGTTCP